MNITTLGYLIFLLGGAFVYYLIPTGYRWKWLIVLSFVCVCSSSVTSLLFILLTSFIVYKSALSIGKAKENKKKSILIWAMGYCFGVLILLKYISALPFFVNNGVHSFVKTYLIPIGLSYYTLQVVSYLLDVYWEKIDVEKDYLKVLLYTCYFPQMVQGPISKYNELAPELFKDHDFDWKNIKYGSELMLWGFFKKMVIADRVGQYVNRIFWNGADVYGLTIVIGLIFYGIQLYCDFSGGIDVIRGASELFGIGLKDNFNQPYFSLSLGEFWRRWHMSLGQWVKDYIFYPVSMSKIMRKLKKALGNKIDKKLSNRIVIALANIIVFIFVGVWHGLGTNYLAWGLYNGLILAISEILDEQYKKWKNVLHIDDKSKGYITFSLIRTLIIVTIGWIFDCALTAKDSLKLFLNIFKLGGVDWSILQVNTDFYLLPIFLILLFVVDIMHEKNISIRDLLNKQSYWKQVIIWTLMIQTIACFGRVISEMGFLYANF